ncbi:hypothetical protein MNBD_BACTEROID03-852 [hydrothermal vent metagenome]|uniref:Uncharacterized protein n=1 Tax=hydrothermal vent metagenome TaxID=652676 RepID=A0A3B0TGW2_9ZZZZ
MVTPVNTKMRKRLTWDKRIFLEGREVDGRRYRR